MIYIEIEAPFIDETSGLAIVKMLDKKAQNTVMLKFKFVQNLATSDVTNSSVDTVIFDPKEMLGIIDLRSVGYYKIKQGTLKKNLSRYYRFESAGMLYKQFNKFVNTFKKENKDRNDKYPWLEQDDERRNMSDMEILDKYVDLEKSCLSDSEKRHVMAIFYKYKDVFSLRDEIGICPNIEVEIDITDKSPFFIRPYHIKEEYKNILDREPKRLCYLGILKEGSF